MAAFGFLGGTLGRGVPAPMRAVAVIREFSQVPSDERPSVTAAEACVWVTLMHVSKDQ